MTLQLCVQSDSFFLFNQSDAILFGFEATQEVIDRNGDGGVGSCGV